MRSRTVRVRRMRVLVATATALALSWAGPPARALLQEVPEPPDPPKNVLYARSVDGGRTFQRFRVTDETFTGFPHVAAADGAVHLVWDAGDSPDRRVVYERSADGGRSFLRPKVLSRGVGDSSESDLAVAGDTVHVAWEGARTAEVDPTAERADEVYLRTSTDRGGSFRAARNVSRTTRRHTRDPDLAIGEGLVGVVYEDSVALQDDVYFRAGRDGRTFRRAVNVSHDGDRSAEPAVAIAGSVVHVLFEDRGDELSDADDRVSYARSVDGGQTFSRPVHLRDEAQRRPAIAVAGDTIHVVACQRVLPSDVYHLRSRDGGRTWSASRLSHTPGECNKPTIAVDGARVVVAWLDDTSGEDDVILRTSTDGGRSFGRTVNVSHNAGSSDDPSLAIDPTTGQVHLTWTDDSPDRLPRLRLSRS